MSDAKSDVAVRRWRHDEVLIAFFNVVLFRNLDTNWANFRNEIFKVKYLVYKVLF